MTPTILALLAEFTVALWLAVICAFALLILAAEAIWNCTKRGAR